MNLNRCSQVVLKSDLNHQSPWRLGLWIWSRTQTCKRKVNLRCKDTQDSEHKTRRGEHLNDCVEDYHPSVQGLRKVQGAIREIQINEQNL